MKKNKKFQKEQLSKEGYEKEMEISEAMRYARCVMKQILL